jgi:hypothetical protein
VHELHEIAFNRRSQNQVEVIRHNAIVVKIDGEAIERFA